MSTLSIKKETWKLVAVGALIALPASLALLAFAMTQNPSLRPLGITFESLSQAGQIDRSGKIIAVVSVGENTPYKTSR